MNQKQLTNKIPMTSTKVLITRFSAIGDIVLTTPLLRCIARQRPDIELHYLTKPQYAFLLQNNPYLHRIHSLQNSVWQTYRNLRAEKFDYLIDLHHNQRTWLFKNLLQVNSQSYNKLNYAKFLATQFHQIQHLPNVHIVDRYLAAAKPLGITDDHEGLDYHIPPDQHLRLADHFPALAERPYIAVVIGATHSTKRLPIENFITLCRLIKRPIILLGGKEDQANAHAIQQALPQLHNACGKYTLHQSASIVQQAYKIVSHDTGLMHIAAAFHRPIATIWGNTIPQFGMYPYYPANSNIPHFTAEVANLNCRPCSKIGYPKCPKKHFNCMTQQNLNDIANWVNSPLITTN